MSDTPSRPVVGQTSQDQPATGTDTITVASKLPNGIVLRAFRWIETTLPTSTGLHTVRQRKRSPAASSG